MWFVEGESADVDGCIVIMNGGRSPRSGWGVGAMSRYIMPLPSHFEGGLTNRPAYASRARDSYIIEARHDVTIAD
jgi:hypothetical protein